jgi:hypothetical protein
MPLVAAHTGRKEFVEKGREGYNKTKPVPRNPMSIGGQKWETRQLSGWPQRDDAAQTINPIENENID